MSQNTNGPSFADRVAVGAISDIAERGDDWAIDRIVDGLSLDVRLEGETWFARHVAYPSEAEGFTRAEAIANLLSALVHELPAVLAYEIARLNP